MIISLVFLVMIVGLIIYMVAKDPKVIEIGRIMFWTGLLAILLSYDKLGALFTR
jgi:Na+/phosphate symporter